MAILKMAISRELLTALVYVPTPKTLDELVETLSSLDLKIRSISFSMDSRGPRISSFGYSNPLAPRQDQPHHLLVHTTSPAPGVTSKPMDLSSTRSGPRGPLMAAERQHRISNNLCLYCGKPGHISVNCPNRWGPSRIASLALDPSSLGKGKATSSVSEN